MTVSDLLERDTSLPLELEHVQYGVFEDSIEDDVAGRVSGRLNAILGLGTRSLVRRISEATCGRGDVYVVHPSFEALNILMDGVVADQATNVDVRRARLDQVPAADGTFDTIFLPLQLHHERNPAAVLREARRTLAPMGKVVLLESLGADSEHSLGAGEAPTSCDVLARWLMDSGLLPSDVTIAREAFRVERSSGSSVYDLILMEASALPPDEGDTHPSSLRA